MIALAADHLVLQMANGENIAVCPETISPELMGKALGLFDSDLVENAANAVFHYFKNELDRTAVSAVEFAGALEKALRGFSRAMTAPACSPAHCRGAESDLRRLADESGQGGELLFFPRLRDELRRALREAPGVLRFRSLRPCVRQLLGARRWTRGCQALADQIVHYLRQCLSAEAGSTERILVVE